MKLIINAPPDDWHFCIRAAKCTLVQYPDSKVVVVAYGEKAFLVRRNKKSVSVFAERKE